MAIPFGTGHKKSNLFFCEKVRVWFLQRNKININVYTISNAFTNIFSMTHYFAKFVKMIII